MIVCSVDVTRIDKSKLIPGKKPKKDGTIAKYLELVIMENRDGIDQYGNTHIVKQGVSKAEREAGVRGDIIGNGKDLSGPRSDRRPESRPSQRQAPVDDLDTTGDEIPFN